MNVASEGFYNTQYSSNTSDGIIDEYNRLYNRIPCNNCAITGVEIIPSISGKSDPLFIILRKHYCFKCWLKIINS